MHPRLEAMQPKIDAVRSELTVLDSIDRDYFSYRFENIEFLPPDRLEAEAYLMCDLRYKGEGGRFTVSFNGGHSFLRLSIDDEVRRDLEAQEFISASDEKLADRIETILRDLSGCKEGDIFMDYMGDYLRFDRKTTCFRGWTGGYRGFVGNMMPITTASNVIWHMSDVGTNLNIRLDSLLFLATHISDRLGFKLDLEDKKTQEDPVGEALARLDDNHIDLIYQIQDDVKLPTDIEISTQPSYHVGSKEMFSAPGSLGPENRWSFTLNTYYPFMRICETVLPGEEMYDGLEKICDRFLDMRKGDLTLLLNRYGDIYSIMYERDLRDYSFGSYKNDMQRLSDIKEDIKAGKLGFFDNIL